MEDLGDPHRKEPGSPAPLPTLGRRRRSSRKPEKGSRYGLTAMILFLVAVVGVWAGMRFFGGDGEETALAPPPEDTVATEGPDASAEVPPLDLPELGMSDAFVRRLVSALSARPELARWLATDDLVERFVDVMIDMAGGSTPASNVRVMAPTEPFRVIRADGRMTIAPESYARFDVVAATFASLDTRGTVRLYRQLLPLIEESYGELGIPDVTFQETLTRAIRNVLAVEIPDGPIEVVEDEAVYVFADPELEGRRGLAKQLIRMGPDNARLVQAKMREFANALGIQP